ncbi:hypothetical protein N7451_012691 [Penicillium sp. IBT 35674x]|nr:hypothetical protein N7451_012691 [Penicillium sp. IBT 35674x]
MIGDYVPWREVAALKRQSIFDAIPIKWRIEGAIPPRDRATGCHRITEHTTTGNWTALEVTEAFCHRAAIAHQLVNCLQEIFFEDALLAAKELDAHFDKTGSPSGPLHGLPVSLKDQFHIRGAESTMGYVGWIGTFEGKSNDPRAKNFESELVKELRDLGAVLFCKTSVPTTLMAGETRNNIIGYTWNPKNRHLSCGGSSGGEGALLALRGSPAGFGTDIGGSIRVPAAFNGVFGLRPSAGRMPYEGVANSMDGQSTILSVVGPMTTSARSLKLLFQAILFKEPWRYDPLVLEMPWKDTVAKKMGSLIRSDASSFAFAVMVQDGVVQPHPPIRNAIQEVVKLLERLGHQVVEWKPPSHVIAQDIARKTFHLDGGDDVRGQLSLSGEEILPECFLQETLPSTAKEIASLNVEKRRYQKRYLDYWNSTAQLTKTGRPVEAIICPVAPSAAVQPGHFKYSVFTNFVNVLDYTSVSIPITCFDSQLQKDEATTTYISPTDEAVHASYDADLYHGAPIGIQLVGQRLQEEKIITLAEYLSEHIGHTFCAK